MLLARHLRGAVAGLDGSRSSILSGLPSPWNGLKSLREHGDALASCPGAPRRSTSSLAVGRVRVDAVTRDGHGAVDRVGDAVGDAQGDRRRAALRGVGRGARRAARRSSIERRHAVRRSAARSRTACRRGRRGRDRPSSAAQVETGSPSSPGATSICPFAKVGCWFSGGRTVIGRVSVAVAAPRGRRGRCRR